MEALSTRRFRLRELVGSDADDLMRIFSDEAAMTFAPMATTRDRAVAISAIEWHQGNYRRFGYSAWAIIGREGEFIGLAGLLPHEIGTELFYSLVRAHWGCGYHGNAELALAQVDDAYEVVSARSRPVLTAISVIGLGLLINVLASSDFQHALNDRSISSVWNANPAGTFCLVAVPVAYGCHFRAHGFYLYWLGSLRGSLRMRFSRTTKG